MRQQAYRLSDGYFLWAGDYDLTREPSYNPALHGIVELPGDAAPDPILERFDAASPTKRRPATQTEINAVLNERRDGQFDVQFVLHALARVVYNYLPLPVRPTTFAAFLDEIKAEYRKL